MRKNPKVGLNLPGTDTDRAGRPERLRRGVLDTPQQAGIVWGTGRPNNQRGQAEPGVARLAGADRKGEAWRASGGGLPSLRQAPYGRKAIDENLATLPSPPGGYGKSMPRELRLSSLSTRQRPRTNWPYRPTGGPAGGPNTRRDTHARPALVIDTPRGCRRALFGLPRSLGPPNATLQKHR